MLAGTDAAPVVLSQHLDLAPTIASGTWTIHRGGTEMLRHRLLAMMIAATLCWLAPRLVGPQSVAATTTVSEVLDLGILTSAEDELVLSTWQERAKAAGAFGFYVDRASNSLVVVAPRSLQTAFAAADLGQVPVPFRIRWSAIEPKAIAELKLRLIDMMEYPALAKESMAFHFDAESEKLSVTTSVEAKALELQLGDAWELVDFHPGGVELLTGRYSDSAPFSGGARIEFDGDPSSSYCTSGVTVANGSIRAMLIPAHCGDPNQGVHSPAGVSFGTIGTDRHCGPAPGENTDFQFIRGKTYQDDIYVNGNPGSLADVVNAAAPNVGAKYRFSGASTYEWAQIEQVSDTDASVWYRNANFCGGASWWVFHVIAFSSSFTPSTCDAQPGDSGAPFYITMTTSPYTVGLRGMVVARDVDSFGNVGPNCYAIKLSEVQRLSGYWPIT